MSEKSKLILHLAKQADNTNSRKLPEQDSSQFPTWPVPKERVDLQNEIKSLFTLFNF